MAQSFLVGRLGRVAVHGVAPWEGRAAMKVETFPVGREEAEAENRQLLGHFLNA